jgi:hypothetical protein
MLLAKRAIPAAVMISGVLFAWKGARIHDCRTRYHQAGAEISILQGELEYYRRENGHYPTTGHRLALSPFGKEADIDPGFALPPVPDMELPTDTGFVVAVCSGSAAAARPLGKLLLLQERRQEICVGFVRSFEPL